MVTRQKSSEPHRSALWNGILIQVEKGWVSGPRPYARKGELRIRKRKVTVNPAYRFGVQQADKLRAIDDLKRSSTNEATSVLTPINLPSWGHIAEMCIFV